MIRAPIKNFKLDLEFVWIYIPSVSSLDLYNNKLALSTNHLKRTSFSVWNCKIPSPAVLNLPVPCDMHRGTVHSPTHHLDVSIPLPLFFASSILLAQHNCWEKQRSKMFLSKSKLPFVFLACKKELWAIFDIGTA